MATTMNAHLLHGLRSGLRIVAAEGLAHQLDRLFLLTGREFDGRGVDDDLDLNSH